MYSKAQFVRTSPRYHQFTDVYDYNKNDKLGQGSYGTVYRAIHKITGINRAVKIIYKQSVKQKERLSNELRIVELLDHPHVIRVFETFEDKDYIYVVMEICNGGDIFDKVLQLGNFNEQQALQIFIQIVRSVVYYQSLKIVHRDLKPENFLFQKNNDLNSLYIIDFGLARLFEPDLQQQWTKAGTAYYVAPEVLEGKYDNKCDLWSIGVILYVLLCGYPPFYGENEAEILYQIKKGKFDFDGPEWFNVSIEVKNLIQELLKPYSQRIALKQILQHQWLSTHQQLGESLLTKQHLDRWETYPQIKKVALLYLATQLNQHDILHIKNAFLFINKSQTGILSEEEVKQYTTISKQLEYYQFIALCLEEPFQEQHILLMFHYLALDNLITTQSLQAIQINIECKIDYELFKTYFII